MGEYEPEDSRNVTGTATTPDGRWTAQGQQPPDAAGQMDQSQMEQSGQSVGQSGEGVSGASNQSNDHTSGIGQEQAFTADEAATGQAGQTGWQTADPAGQVREGQSVVDSQGQHVGTVDSIDGDRIKLTRKDSADGQHHYISASQVEASEGDQVRLNCSADQLQG